VGRFPALTELWILDRSGNPFCVVFPTATARSVEVATPGSDLQCAGTYLRNIRYRAGDDDRLAPLIVGAESPRRARQSPEHRSTNMRSLMPWPVALTLLAFVVALFAALHLRRRRFRWEGLGPTPAFVAADEPLANPPETLGDAPEDAAGSTDESERARLK
jgi:hypothetical protein